MNYSKPELRHRTDLRDEVNDGGDWWQVGRWEPATKLSTTANAWAVIASGKTPLEAVKAALSKKHITGEEATALLRAGPLEHETTEESEVHTMGKGHGKAEKTEGDDKPQKPKQLKIKVPIDKDIIQLKRAKLFETEKEIDRLKAKKREVSQEFTDKLKEASEQRKALLEQIESGLQEVTVPTLEKPDMRRGMMLVVRTDTGEAVDERALTVQERNVDLFEGEDSAAAKKKGGRKGGEARA